MHALNSIKFETKDFWVKETEFGYEVYQKGATGSRRCAQIGWPGLIGLEKAKAECLKRQAEIQRV